MAVELHPPRGQVANLVQLAVKGPGRWYDGPWTLNERVGRETEDEGQKVDVALVASGDEVVREGRLVDDGHQRVEVVEVKGDDGEERRARGDVVQASRSLDGSCKDLAQVSLGA